MSEKASEIQQCEWMCAPCGPPSWPLQHLLSGASQAEWTVGPAPMTALESGELLSEDLKGRGGEDLQQQSWVPGQSSLVAQSAAAKAARRARAKKMEKCILLAGGGLG